MYLYSKNISPCFWGDSLQAIILIANVVMMNWGSKAISCFILQKVTSSTWHRSLRYDREGVGRQADHSSGCFSLSPPHPAGKSPLSWPEVSWCSRWISLLSLHSRHAAPSGTKRPQEIWAQTFPVKAYGGEQGSVLWFSKTYYTCLVLTWSVSFAAETCSHFLCEYFNISIRITKKTNHCYSPIHD